MCNFVVAFNLLSFFCPSFIINKLCMKYRFRGKKERSGWYFVHWIIGILVSLVAIFNIYTGLEAYHKKTSRSIGLWNILFTLEVSLIAFFYLFLDKREYIKNQGVILGDLQESTYDQAQRNIQKDSLPEPYCKPNALKNLFD